MTELLVQCTKITVLLCREVYKARTADTGKIVAMKKIIMKNEEEGVSIKIIKYSILLELNYRQFFLFNRHSIE